MTRIIFKCACFQHTKNSLGQDSVDRNIVHLIFLFPFCRLTAAKASTVSHVRSDKFSVLDSGSYNCIITYVPSRVSRWHAYSIIIRATRCSRSFPYRFLALENRSHAMSAWRVPLWRQCEPTLWYLWENSRHACPRAVPLFFSLINLQLERDEPMDRGRLHLLATVFFHNAGVASTNAVVLFYFFLGC